MYFTVFPTLVISPIEDTSASHGVHHQTARRTYNTRRALCLSVLLQMKAGRGLGPGGEAVLRIDLDEIVCTAAESRNFHQGIWRCFLLQVSQRRNLHDRIGRSLFGRPGLLP
jgi:hypothetical protein